MLIRSVGTKWRVRLSAHPWYRPCYSTQRRIDPLRILFCGSDNFSICSLRAIAELLPSIVKSIDVVCKTPKPTGRGYKKLTYPPIYHVAKSLSLPVHTIPTFTGWQPPSPIDLVIAVSFGLLVPPRILSAAQYGGLNVHPSMLPDLYGPAPIQWSLIHNDRFRGVTLQTLHPSHFDQGSILDQTPHSAASRLSSTPGTLPSLSDLTDGLGCAGAAMLVRSLTTGSFAQPQTPPPLSTPILYPPRYAPKLTPNDARLDGSWTEHELLARAAVCGPLWDDVTYNALEALAAKHKGQPDAAPARQGMRIQYLDWQPFDTFPYTETPRMHRLEPHVADAGTYTPPVVYLRNDRPPALVVRAGDYWAPGSVKVEGKQKQPVANFLERFVWKEPARE